MTEHEINVQAYGPWLAEQIERGQAAARAAAPGYGSQTSFAVDTGLGGQWSRLVQLASDGQAFAAALQAQWGSAYLRGTNEPGR
jgi:hypothetical protein